jgi:hypothetical protein
MFEPKLICAYCGHNKFKIEFIQTRTLDEAQTKELICEKCDRLKLKENIKEVGNWTPINGRHYEMGHFLVSEMVEPLIQQELDAIRVRKNPELHESSVSHILRDDKKRIITYCFHNKNIDQITKYWQKKIQIKLIDVMENINDNEITISEWAKVKYGINEKSFPIKNLKDIYKMIVREGINIPEPQILDYDDYRVPKSIKNILNKKFNCVSVIKGDHMDKLKKHRIKAICDSISSIQKYYGTISAIRYVTTLLENFLPYNHSFTIAKALLLKGIYKGIDSSGDNYEPLKALLAKKVEWTLINIIEKGSVDYLTNSISQLIVGQPIFSSQHKLPNDDNMIDDEIDNNTPLFDDESDNDKI